jgi:8-oxo-dGTP diphosphatase
MLIRDGSLLMQHRALWVHNGDTWGIPGGARDSHESPIEAAIREAKEEIGMHANLLTPIYTFEDNHGNWKYDTVIASAEPELIAHELNTESLQVQWVGFDEVGMKILHPSFAKTWPELRTILQELLM